MMRRATIRPEMNAVTVQARITRIMLAVPFGCARRAPGVGESYPIQLEKGETISSQL